MSAERSEKCAHVPCLCIPPKGEKYCSQLRKQARKKRKLLATVGTRLARSEVSDWPSTVHVFVPQLKQLEGSIWSLA